MRNPASEPLEIEEFVYTYGTLVYETTDREGYKVYTKMSICNETSYCFEDGFEWMQEDGHQLTE